VIVPQAPELAWRSSWRFALAARLDQAMALGSACRTHLCSVSARPIYSLVATALIPGVADKRRERLRGREAERVQPPRILNEVCTW
jgi:hypothetical protein